MKTFIITRVGCFGWLTAALLMTSAGVVRGQFSYTINVDNTITITGYSGTNVVLTIPSTTNGLTVTCIGLDAFEDYQNLTSVMIPASVTNIGKYAFEECISLTGIYFQGNPPSIDTSAFLYDTDVTLYCLPGNTNWGATVDYWPTATWNIFSYTTNSDNTIAITGFIQSPPPVNAITIPNTINGLTVGSIGSMAFYDCDGLASVTISDSVTNIGDEAFSAATA